MKRAPCYSYRQHHSCKTTSVGIDSVSEISQVEISNLIAGIAGTANLQDDIIVWENSLLEQDN